jgi:hypothetical protein
VLAGLCWLREQQMTWAWVVLLKDAIEPTIMQVK